MKLGFVGVGRWAQKLATAFRACGAEIVCHDRGSKALPHCDGLTIESIDGFGVRVPWREQLASHNVDAIIAVAPPEVTTEVALACAAAGKAVMATKPLFDHPETIRAPFYVDLWRLWSEAHLTARAGIDSTKLLLNLYGSGPVRSFPGMFDYGPHVMAAAMDYADGPHELFRATSIQSDTGDLYVAALKTAKGIVATKFGNGAPESHRSMWGLRESATHIGAEPKTEILQRFCQSFLNDISEGFVDTRLLRLSRDGMRELRKIREMATASDPTRR